jgi:hypothetical protein
MKEYYLQLVLSVKTAYSPEGVIDNTHIPLVVVHVLSDGGIVDAIYHDMKYRLTDDDLLEDWTGQEFELWPSSLAALKNAICCAKEEKS